MCIEEITGPYPAGFLVLVYLIEIKSPLVALMPFWSPPYLLKIQNANHSSFAPGVTPKVYKVYKDKAFSQELRLLACS